jgi:hypothetical protein
MNCKFHAKVQKISNIEFPFNARRNEQIECNYFLFSRTTAADGERETKINYHFAGISNLLNFT